MMSKNATYIAAVGLATLGMLTGVWMIFVYAPADANMGVVQKIFYFHLPSAYMAALGWLICTVSSVVYLVGRKERFDKLAVSAAELALLFALMVLITGPLWGRKSWGAYWTWDPRLTSTLLFTFVMVAYVLLRRLASGEAERRFAAALSIFGTCVLPIIHISVVKWRGQHPTVISAEGGGIGPEMGHTLSVSIVGFALLFLALLMRRYRLESAIRTAAELRNRATLLKPAQEIDS